MSKGTEVEIKITRKVGEISAVVGRYASIRMSGRIDDPAAERFEKQAFASLRSQVLGGFDYSQEKYTPDGIHILAQGAETTLVVDDNRQKFIEFNCNHWTVYQAYVKAAQKS